jgi:hypothetical protein
MNEKLNSDWELKWKSDEKKLYKNFMKILWSVNDDFCRCKNCRKLITAKYNGRNEIRAAKIVQFNASIN